MTEVTGTARVRISVRSAFIVVGALALTALVLAMLASSVRVIGWMLVAAAVAGLVYPIVARLDRHMPRGIAVAIVVLAALGSIGAGGYALVNDIQRQTERLEEIISERARELERSDRFGEAAREFDLEERAENFVEAIPARLAGGEGAEAARSATERGLAFVATTVLAVFVLLQGRRFKEGALAQLRDPVHRARAAGVVSRVYRRSFGYARGTLAMSLATGLFTYALARIAGVPGAVVLATWAAVWDIVPVLGFPIGVTPIVILAAFDSPITALVLLGVFIAYEVFEVVVLQSRLERHTMRVGRFLTVLAAFGGLELYGLGGALLAVLAMAGLVALSEELSEARSEEMAPA